MTSELVLLAPFPAWLSPLEEVPDEVFAGRMLGDGIALDPLDGAVHAPCDGRVSALAPTGHSVTLTTTSGVEVLIHVGVDTVALGGKGFEPCVGEGVQVTAGDLLLRFDLDAVARAAKSLMTPMLVLTTGRTVTPIAPGRQVRRGEPVCRVAIAPEARPDAYLVQGSGEAVSRTVVIPLAHGLHARPAARIAASLKLMSADVSLIKGDRTANARSVTALLALGAANGDAVRIDGRGADGAAAVAAIAELIASGMGEHGPSPAATSEEYETVISAAGEIAAVRAAPGEAFGLAFLFAAADRELPAIAAGVEHERDALLDALARLRPVLAQAGHTHAVSEAHLAIVDDPDLLTASLERIAAGASAAQAWRAATQEQVAAIRATGNAHLSERTADLIDCERRVIDVILGGDAAKRIEVPKGSILIAEELLPSDFLAIDTSRLAGIVTAAGGPTSHVAILAAAQEVPMLVGAGGALRSIADKTPLLIDGSRAVLVVAPDTARVSAHRRRAASRAAAAVVAAERAQRPAITADGTTIDIFANCGSVDEARLAVVAGAEGCGLFRTEFLFLDRTSAPKIDEQAEVYGRVAAEFGDRPVLLRTLDAGSDKPLAYLRMPREENPALGMRGLRIALANPAVLTDQFRAILRGVPTEQRRIMLPMVNDLGEFRLAQTLLRKVEAEEDAAEPTPLGVMIETPSAALLAGQLAAEADFLSIGTNDLTQYTLAIDRGHAALAATADPLHPAVLRLIAEAVRGARAHGRWIGVCGTVASDIDAALLLIGLGVNELSAIPAQIPELKARIAGSTMRSCRALAAAALAEEIDAGGVRRLIAGFAEGGNNAQSD